MIKKIFFVFLMMIIIPSVNASATSGAMVGNRYYDNIVDAIKNASSDETVVLLSDANLDETLTIDKTVNIDLNGNNITAPSNVFLVQGGVLNVSGEGTIRETEPSYAAIMLKGSQDKDDENYSIVNVSKDVTLEGWSGIFITHDENKSYGVVANLSGKINAINDIDGGEGIGVYINGSIKDQINSPIVNILDGAEIGSTGNGIYIAGYTTVNIGKAYIEGTESGIGIKAGKLNIDGASIVCEGKDYTPTGGYNNGVKPSGTALQIESNSGYAGDIKINIKSGTLRSKNSNSLYEYIGSGSVTQVNSIKISGGTFISNANKDVIRVSDSFKNNHDSFITGGKYSSDPSSFLESGYTVSFNDGMYNVIKSTMREIGSGNSNNKSNNFGVSFIIIISIFIVGFLVYMNRKRIVKMFN